MLSECIPQRQLNHPRLIALCRNLAKVRGIIDVRAGRTENDLVESVYEFGAELDFMAAFFEIKILEHGQLGVAVTVAAHIRVVARGVAEDKVRRLPEESSVEPGVA